MQKKSAGKSEHKTVTWVTLITKRGAPNLFFILAHKSTTARADSVNHVVASASFQGETCERRC